MADNIPDNMTDDEREALRRAWVILDTEVNRRDSFRL